MQWLQEGDRNKFFHTKTFNRKRKNKLEDLFDEQEKWCVDKEKNKRIMIVYFNNIFILDRFMDMEDVLRVIEP